MENVGQIFKDGFKKISEAAMDAMVQSLIANQEQHFQHLQDMQKWGIVKIFQKFASSRFLHKTPCVEAGSRLSLFDIIKKKNVDKDHVSNDYNKVLSNLPSIGELELTVHQAKFILLGNNVTTQDSLWNKYEWKVIFRYGVSSVESTIAQLVASTYEPPEFSALLQDKNTTLLSSTLNSWGLTADSRKRSSSNTPHKIPTTPHHELHWDTSLILKDIQDLWGDICIEILWRKIESQPHDDSATDSKRSFKNKNLDTTTHNQINDKHVMQDKAALSEPLGNKLLPAQYKNNLTNLDSSSYTASLASQAEINKSTPEGLPDLCPGSRKPPGPTWQLYGRSIIPLISVIYSFAMNNKEENTKEEILSPPYYTALSFWETVSFALVKIYPAHFWLHLFPHNSHEIKFYRPVPGYSGLGMSNPKTTLGFLEITLKLKMHQPLPLASIISMLHPPQTYWRNSYFFEPQYLETYGLRFKHLLLTFPRWIPKFLHLATHSGNSIRNVYDWFCIFAFWLLLINCCLFASLWTVPAHITLCITSISLSYLLGNHFIQPAYTTTLLCRQSAKTGSPIDLKNITAVDTYPRTTHVNKKDGLNEKTSPKTSPKTSSFSFSRKNLKLSSKLAFLDNSSDKKQAFFKSKSPLKNVFEASSNSLFEESTKSYDFNRTVRHSSISTVDSPFGPLQLNVNDPSSYFPKYPVFSDDAGDHDIHELFDSGVTVLDNVQRLTAISSYVVEKLKFAFNWEDPLLTFVSLVFLLLVSMCIYGYLFVMSYFPLWVSRLPIMGPLIVFMLFTDPWFHKNVWLRHFNLDLPFLYKAFILRSHYRKKNHNNYFLPTVEEKNKLTKKTLTNQEDSILTTQNALKFPNSDVPDLDIYSKSSFQEASPDTATVNLINEQQLQFSNNTKDTSGSTRLLDSSKHANNFFENERNQQNILEETATEKDSPTTNNMWQTMLDRWFIRQKGMKKLNLFNNKETAAETDVLVGNTDCRTIQASNVPGNSSPLRTTSSNNTYTPLKHAYESGLNNIFKKGVLVKSIPRAKKQNEKNTDAEPLAKQVPGLEVFELLASVGQQSPSCNRKSLFQLICIFFQTLLQFLSRKILHYLQKLIRTVIRPCTFALSFVGYSILIIFDACFQSIMYWWLHLPDRREIEHRQVAATQCIKTLVDLIPNKQSSKNKDYNCDTDFEDFVFNYFNQPQNSSKQPLSGGLIKLTPTTSLSTTRSPDVLSKATLMPNRTGETTISGISTGVSLIGKTKQQLLHRLSNRTDCNERLTSSCSVPGVNDSFQNEKADDITGSNNHFSDSEGFVSEPLKI